jgi:hypothetical protein
MVMMKKSDNLDFETWSVALGQPSSVMCLKTLFETSVISFSQQLKNVLPISVATWNFLYIFFRFSRAVAVYKSCTTPTVFPLKARKLKFWLPEFQPT